MNKDKQMHAEQHSDSVRYTRLKPIKLYDHLPGILAGYPAILFLIFSLLTLPNEYFAESKANAALVAAASNGEIEADAKANSAFAEAWTSIFDSHMMFWVGVSVMIIWYIAFRFNLPKGKFWLAFGLLGTFIGIPVVLEISGYFRVFETFGNWLGVLKPEINAAAWFVFSAVFFGIWLGNFIWSRTHMRVTIDESGLTINRVGGKGERFDLIGLKTENEPLDYLELFIGGIGSLSLKTRMNKPIFTLKRVYGLYRIPIFPFFKGKLARVEEMLTYQGKVVAVDPRDRIDMAEALESEGEGEEDLDDGNDDFDRDVDSGADANQGKDIE